MVFKGLRIMNIYNLSRGIQNDITVSFNSFQITAIIYDHVKMIAETEK